MVHNCCSQWWSLVSYAFYSTKFDTFGHDKYISHVENMDYLRSIIAVCSLRTSAWRPEAHSYGDFLRQHSCRVLDKTNGRPLAVGDKRAATARPIGMRQRHNHSGATTVASIAGKSNDMADIASRVFNEKFPAHLLDSPFQYYFSDSRITKLWSNIIPVLDPHEIVVYCTENAHATVWGRNKVHATNERAFIIKPFKTPIF